MSFTQPDTPRDRAAGSSIFLPTLPPGPALLATFTGSGDIVGGAPTDPGVELGRTFTVQGTGDQGEPLYQASSILVDQNLPLAINASGGTDLVGTVGQPFAQNFFLSGGAGPYTWSMASGQLPPASGYRPSPIRETQTTSSPEHRPRPAATHSPCDSPTTPASKAPRNSPSPSIRAHAERRRLPSRREMAERRM